MRSSRGYKRKIKMGIKKKNKKSMIDLTASKTIWFFILIVFFLFIIFFYGGLRDKIAEMLNNLLQ